MTHVAADVLSLFKLHGAPAGAKLPSDRGCVPYCKALSPLSLLSQWRLQAWKVGRGMRT